MGYTSDIFNFRIASSLTLIMRGSLVSMSEARILRST